MKNKILIWTRAFSITFLVSFISIIFGVAVIVVASLYRQMGGELWKDATITLIVSTWLHGYLVKQVIVSAFLGILVASKRTLESS